MIILSIGRIPLSSLHVYLLFRYVNHLKQAIPFFLLFLFIVNQLLRLVHKQVLISCALGLRRHSHKQVLLLLGAIAIGAACHHYQTLASETVPTLQVAVGASYGLIQVQQACQLLSLRVVFEIRSVKQV